MALDPIHQFQLEPLFKIGQIGDHAIYFTNSSAYMFLAVALISLLMIGGVARKQLVPGRFQSIAEITYEFVASTIRSTAGSEGMKFFPLILYRLHNGVNRVYSDKVRRLPGQAVFLHGGVIRLNHLIRRNRWSNAARPRCGG
jgi:hypothetical protein